MSDRGKIDFRYDDLALGRSDSRWVELFERLRSAFRAARDSIEQSEGVVKLIRYNVPPTTPPTVAALPTASAKLHRQIVLLDNNGTANDTLHICIRDNVGAYVWKQFTLF